jgi:ADP-dependent NAD(P)H-hydrate dehydratase / NAD(P)H-hydrate epimerase
MKRLLTAEQMREVDAAAGREFGMPEGILMENAGEALAHQAMALADSRGRFVVVCGLGNNGGDGFVAARKLYRLGREVHVQLCGAPERLAGEAARNHRALLAEGVPVTKVTLPLYLGSGDVVIDAMLGTGINRPPADDFAKAIGQVAAWRKAGAKVLAADIPSGLSSDTGMAFAPCVEADVTLAFGYLKVGEVVEPGASHAGRVVLTDIGIPAAAANKLKGPRVLLLEEEDVRKILPRRSAESHKGTYGHVLVVAGSRGKTGAAALAGLSALRTGAGRVTVATRPDSLVPILAHAPELMGTELGREGPLGVGDLEMLLHAAEQKQAMVFGPGIPRGDETTKLLGGLLERLRIPCVVDADGLNALAGHLDLLHSAQAPVVLTPHPGEMARLLGKTTAEVQAHRVEFARAFAEQHQVHVILKGARTVIASPDGTLHINPTGNPGMASAGTGDVLAGMCGALLAQGLSVEDATLVAPYAHGLAGDIAMQRTGQLGLIARDIVGVLGEVWRRWER